MVALMEALAKTASTANLPGGTMGHAIICKYLCAEQVFEKKVMDTMFNPRLI